MEEALKPEIEIKKLEMRTLSGQDLFPMLKILSKVKVKDMVVDFLKKRDEMSKTEEPLTEAEITALGIEVFADIVNTAMGNLDLAKEEINRLLAGLCGVSIKEIETLGMLDYTTLVFEFFSKEELNDFFKCISSSSAFKNLL